MRYDSFFSAFTVTIRMREGAQFKFVIGGNYEASWDYPMVYVASTLPNTQIGRARVPEQ